MVGIRAMCIKYISEASFYNPFTLDLPVIRCVTWKIPSVLPFTLGVCSVTVSSGLHSDREPGKQPELSETGRKSLRVFHRKTPFSKFLSRRRKKCVIRGKVDRYSFRRASSTILRRLPVNYGCLARLSVLIWKVAYLKLIARQTSESYYK